MDGRSSKIRTYDPHVPNVVLYQAELYSDAYARRAFYTVLRAAQRTPPAALERCLSLRKSRHRPFDFLARMGG